MGSLVAEFQIWVSFISGVSLLIEMEKATHVKADFFASSLGIRLVKAR